MDFSIVLFDNDPSRDSLLPLVATRPISDLRVGILTIRQKWELLTHHDVSYYTKDYLQVKFPLNPCHSVVFVIDAAILPTQDLIQYILVQDFYCKVVDKDKQFIAVKLRKEDLPFFNTSRHIEFSEKLYTEIYAKVSYPEDIFLLNSKQISSDIEILNLVKSDLQFWEKTNFLGNDVYIDRSAVLDYATIDSRQGTVFIAADVVLEPDVVVKGPVAIGKGSRIKAGAVLYPNVTIGPNCTIGGELTNSVIWGNSAKGHSGYLGCAVVGEGCNLGAGTTNSNLKNDWSTVKLYDYVVGALRDTGLSKCGVIIGDQSMLGIQSKINTGTVIGVGAQVAMSVFIPKFVPDFSWFTDTKKESYIFERFVQMMRRKSTLKNEVLEEKDLLILKQVYNKYEGINK